MSKHSSIATSYGMRTSKPLVLPVKEVVRYNNKLNSIALTDFTDAEIKLFFAICSKLKYKGTDEITFTFDQLKELTNEKQHYTTAQYAELIQSMYSKLIHLTYTYSDGENDIVGEFNLFEGYERSLNEKTITISVTKKFSFLFNELIAQFTRFELEEFVNLRGIYPKLLYRQLKQWRMVGHWSVPFDEFRRLMNVPDSYATKDITRRIIEPSVKKLSELKSFDDLKWEYSKAKGKTVVRVIFDWKSQPQIDREEDIHSKLYL